MIGFWASRERGEGFDLGALHVAGDDEEEEVAMTGDVAGLGFADFAADLVDAWGIDDDELGSLETGAVGGVVLPALGSALDGGAVRGADGEDFLTHERVQNGRLAATDHAEGGDLDGRFVELAAEVAQLGELAGERGFFLGGQLQAGEGRFEACLGALDGLVFIRDLGFQLAEDFIQLGVSHGMSLSLSRRTDRLLAPVSDLEQLVSVTVEGDELDRDGETVGSESDRERDGWQAEIAPGGVECRITGRGWAGGGADGCRGDHSLKRPGLLSLEVRDHIRHAAVAGGRAVGQVNGATFDDEVADSRGIVVGMKIEPGRVDLGGLGGHDHPVVFQDLSKSTGSSISTTSAPDRVRTRVASSNAWATGGFGSSIEEASEACEPGRSRKGVGAGRRFGGLFVRAAQGRHHQSEVVDGAGERADLVEARRKAKAADIQEMVRAASCRRHRRTRRGG